MTTTNDGLVKLDCIGRVRFSREQRESMLDAYEASGLSGPQFCAQHGVKYQTFATWLQRRKRGDGRYPALLPAGAAPVPLFLPTEVDHPASPAASGTPVEVVFPGGASILIRDDGQLALAAKLIRELSRPC